jgi:rSAM/selenodomain-associated transferase 2
MVSVIIPTLNEADVIASSLRRLLEHQGDFEVIVVDGGSADGTVDIIQRYPQVRLAISKRGRGIQMNAGARLASGYVLLFLHADTYLPPAGLEMIGAAMADSRVVGGAFLMNFDSPNLLLRAMSRFTRINHILFTYGDQGLFVRANTFADIGGFKSLSIMEDVEIQRRLRSRGTFVKIRHPVTTSARRFIRVGILRQQFVNTILVLLFHLGVSPSVLERYYPY